jgi:phosphoglycerol transferase
LPLRIFAVLAAVAAGLVFPYWAFFTCICIAIGCCIGFVRTKSVSVMVSAALLLLIVGAAKLADMTPTFVHWQRHGMSKALQFRNVADADIYGLTIRQMLRPVMAHPVPVLRKIHDKISAAGFPNDQNESSAAALGTLAAAGFLLLVFVAICRPTGRMLGDDRIRILSAFVIALVLIAEVGGFGSLFNVFVAREFRTYNRISPFIALFCLATIGIILDRALRRRGLVVRYLSAGAVVLFGVIDQIPARIFENPTRLQRFSEDRRFFSELETRLAPKAMIFQLPNTPLPPAEHLGAMDDYAHVRPYLHTKALRWSWGTMVGRYNDWPTKVALLQPPELLKQVALAGFDGILLNRFGYPDRTKEQKITEALGAAAQFDSGKEWIFFDVRGYRDELFRSLSPAEVQKLQENLFTETSVSQYVPGTPILFGKQGGADRYKRGGWSGTEFEFTWTEGNSAALEFPAVAGQPVILKVLLSALTSDPILVYANDRQIGEWRPTTAPVEYSAAIPADLVDVSPSLRITFRITNPVSPKTLGLSSDSRLLGICVYKLVFTPNSQVQ